MREVGRSEVTCAKEGKKKETRHNREKRRKKE